MIHCGLYLVCMCECGGVVWCVCLCVSLSLSLCLCASLPLFLSLSLSVSSPTHHPFCRPSLPLSRSPLLPFSTPSLSLPLSLLSLSSNLPLSCLELSRDLRKVPLPQHTYQSPHYIHWDLSLFLQALHLIRLLHLLVFSTVSATTFV
jgi:hypothetical protein